jgi:hypothetical protein
LISGFKQQEAYTGKSLGRAIQSTIESKVGAKVDVVAGLIAAMLKGEKGTWDGKEVVSLPVGADA